MFLSSTIAATKRNGRSACHNTKSGVSVRRVETSSFHSHKPGRKTFFSPGFLLPLCEFARLPVSSGTRRANSFLPALGVSLFGWMDLGSREGDFWPHTTGRKWLVLCMRCALKAKFALIVMSEVPVALLSYALRLCTEMEDKKEYENRTKGDTWRRTRGCPAERRAGERGAESSSEGHV